MKRNKKMMLFSFFAWVGALFVLLDCCVCLLYIPAGPDGMARCRIVIWSFMSAEWETLSSAFSAHYDFFFFQASDCGQKYLVTMHFFFTPHVACQCKRHADRCLVYKLFNWDLLCSPRHVTVLPLSG